MIFQGPDQNDRSLSYEMLDIFMPLVANNQTGHLLVNDYGIRIKLIHVFT